MLEAKIDRNARTIDCAIRVMERARRTVETTGVAAARFACTSVRVVAVMLEAAVNTTERARDAITVAAVPMLARSVRTRPRVTVATAPTAAARVTLTRRIAVAMVAVWPARVAATARATVATAVVAAEIVRKYVCVPVVTLVEIDARTAVDAVRITRTVLEAAAEIGCVAATIFAIARASAAVTGEAAPRAART